MKCFVLLSASLCAFTLLSPLNAQDMPGMDHSQMEHATHDQSNPPSSPKDHADMKGMVMPESSAQTGTTRSAVHHETMQGLHWMSGDWMLMAHGYVWGIYSNQGGPRGDDRAFAASMAMVETDGPLSDQVKLQLRTMVSLDPVMGQRGYPLLFATGETAHGQPLVDRQHPHDLFMELSGRIDVETGAQSSLFLYGGPVADPALGPTAFMHRASARYNPEAPITHHWFDSTHITYGVVTGGVRTGAFQFEASGFRGREPDERRWNIETPKLDSWSICGTWTPSDHWSAQLSYGRLTSPEVLHPDEDEGRFTASASYSGARLDATAGYSRKQRLPGRALNAWFGEANFAATAHHNLFGRIEVVENDELFGEASALHDQMFRIAKVTGGYAYAFPLTGPLTLAIGGSGSVYAVPERIRFAYGSSPKSFTLFAKLSLGN